MLMVGTVRQWNSLPQKARDGVLASGDVDHLHWQGLSFSNLVSLFQLKDSVRLSPRSVSHEKAHLM